MASWQAWVERERELSCALSARICLKLFVIYLYFMQINCSNKLAAEFPLTVEERVIIKELLHCKKG